VIRVTPVDFADDDLAATKKCAKVIVMLERSEASTGNALPFCFLKMLRYAPA